jgi:hypothetical protein
MGLRSCAFLSALSFTILLARPAHAEAWLNDNLYVDNQQYLQLGSHNSRSVNLRFLPEISFVQTIPTSSFTSKVILGSKLDLQTAQTQINADSKAIINEFNLTTALHPNLTFTLGRQKITHSQQGLFRTSLNKNDLRATPLEELTFSQGLLTTLRLGVIEQSLLFNHKTEKKESKPSYHYQLKVGIPGYKVGPFIVLLSREHNVTNITNNQMTNRAMLGSAIQFPLGIVAGDWQWAFQYGSEFNNDNHGSAQAWQSSLSWLGFIPNHKLGFLQSQTDSKWAYSDDFTPATNRIELSYQWLIHQRLTIGLATSQLEFRGRSEDTVNDVALSASFVF